MASLIDLNGRMVMIGAKTAKRSSEKEPFEPFARDRVKQRNRLGA